MNPSVLQVLALLVPLAPLVAALVTARPSRVGDQTYGKAWWGFVIGLAAAIAVLAQLISDATPIRLELFSSPWPFLPEVVLSVDRLAAVMMVLISGIGTLLYRYSTRYLQQDAAQPRFHTLLALCVTSLLVMVASADLITLVVCWQLLSWFLALLTHNHNHGPTAQSSFRIFLTLRLGDVAFLAGIALAYKLFGTLELAQLFEVAAADDSLVDLRFATLSGTTAVALLIFVGAMCKSAQFPLHLWLPDSLFAPTPVSGLLHAGIINGGGFLLTRLAPLYSLSTPTLHVVFVVGLITTIVGTAAMLVQNDIKKALVYSTIGQMGFMIMECGVGAFSMAVFHLAAHGLFKATLFLNCGDVIRQARQEPKSPPTKASGTGPSGAGWIGGFVTSLALPLAILIGIHELLGIDLAHSQGHQIFLFFSWVTASHAMLTLFRVKKTGAMAQGALLIAITVIALGYLFAAEEFAHLLYPDPAVIQAFFDAAALPEGLFLGIAGVTVALMAAAWIVAYRQRHGTGSRPLELRTDLYLLFMNSFYVGTIAARLHDTFESAVRRIDRATPIQTVIGYGAVVGVVYLISGTPYYHAGVIPAVLAGLLLPLFPLHGLYVAAVTRAPRGAGLVAAIAMPLAGLRVLAFAAPDIATRADGVSSGIYGTIEVLALLGGVHGSVMAMVQRRAINVLAHGGVAVNSILWWHVANVGSVTGSALVFGLSAALGLGGLVLAVNCLRERFGDLDIRALGGLVRPMPALSLCFALLVMAAVGLPPFGLFFGFMGMLTTTPESITLSSSLVFVAWLGSSWYLFRLMQRLLFGPHREDLEYDDLRSSESTLFALVIVGLVLLSAVPTDWAQSLVTTLSDSSGGAQ